MEDEREVFEELGGADRLPHLVRDLGGWVPLWGTWAIVQYLPTLVWPLAIWKVKVWAPFTYNHGGVGLTVFTVLALAIGPLLVGYAMGVLTFGGRSPLRAARALVVGVAVELRDKKHPSRIIARGRSAEAVFISTEEGQP